MTTTLTIKRADLRNAVSYILPAIAPTVLHVLKHLEMRLDPAQNRIELNATDIEIRMGITLPAEITIAGEAMLNSLIPAQTFADILGMLEGEQVRLEITDYELLIHTGGSKTRLSLSTEDSFPPEFSLATNASLLSLSTQDLKQALGRVISAASTDYSRPVLNTICFDLKGSDLRLVAADGFRLAVDLVSVKSAVAEEGTYLIPLKSAQKLLRSLPQDDEPLSIQADEGRMLFRWGEQRFWASRMEGTFPDWRQIVYSADGFTLPGDARPFSRDALMMAVKRAEIFARDGGTHVIHFTPSDTGMRVSGRSDELGQSEEEVACDIHLPFNLNGLYLLQALAGMEREFPHLHLTGSNQPVIFAEDEYICVIMPMAIQEPSVPVKNAEEAVPV
jgi:DNA polymerase-3 subunit beta